MHLRPEVNSSNHVIATAHSVSLGFFDKATICNASWDPRACTATCGVRSRHFGFQSIVLPFLDNLAAVVLDRGRLASLR